MSYNYKIEEIAFREGTSLALPELTVFIGPNSAGKSRTLKDIVDLTCSDRRETVVVRSARTRLPPAINSLHTDYGIAPRKENQNQMFSWLRPTLDTSEGFGVSSMQWPNEFAGYATDPRTFARVFGGQLTAFLSTEMRLRLVTKGASEDIRGVFQNLLQAFYAAGSLKEMEVRGIVKHAFPDVEVALDFSVPAIVQFRVAKTFKNLPSDPREARPILAQCQRLDDEGDGLRSYVGLVVALTCLRRSVYLIDEPEAFLHPPQAFRMGEFIASQASSDKQVVVATHSADFLRGIIFHAPEAQIIRIDRVDDSNVIKVLNKENLRRVATDPLLSAANVLDGLFYSCVVVTEAESDSRFYHAISQKFSGGSDVYFVNADNKQTVPKVLAPYKNLGVRCAGILDIDALNDAEEFRKQLVAAGLSENLMIEALSLRNQIAEEIGAISSTVRLQRASESLSKWKVYVEKALAAEGSEHEKCVGNVRSGLEQMKAETSAWHALKKGGVSTLTKTRSQFERLYEICRDVGLFINPSGELEASLSNYGVEWRADKRAWINQALQLVPSMESDSTKQPWKLMADVHAYLSKAGRPA